MVTNIGRPDLITYGASKRVCSGWFSIDETSEHLSLILGTTWTTIICSYLSWVIVPPMWRALRLLYRPFTNNALLWSTSRNALTQISHRWWQSLSFCFATRFSWVRILGFPNCLGLRILVFQGNSYGSDTRLYNVIKFISGRHQHLSRIIYSVSCRNNEWFFPLNC